MLLVHIRRKVDFELVIVLLFLVPWGLFYLLYWINGLRTVMLLCLAADSLAVISVCGLLISSNEHDRF